MLKHNLFSSNNQPVWNKRIYFVFLNILASFIILLIMLWGAFALKYQLIFSTYSIIFIITIWCCISCLMLFAIWRYKNKKIFLLWLLSLCLLLIWWSTIKPSNHRQWADDVAMQLQGNVSNNIVTLYNVRDFNWRTDDDYDIHWETRRYDLNQIKSIDVALSYWMGPAIAHTLVSFGFDDGSHVTFSVEIRKKKGESFSAVGGFFKQFEMSVVAADERDILYVRTNVRDEHVHLYHVKMSAEASRALFLSYVAKANTLINTPEFYNTLTANCTTIVFDMVKHIVSGLPMDYRLILSGYLPGYLYAIGALDQHYSLQALETAGGITQRAIQYGNGPDFSAVIREGMPGND